MSRRVAITTPEGVQLEYNLAGVGSRFLAVFADTMIQAGLALVCGIVALSLGYFSSGFQGSSGWIIAGLLGTLFLIGDGYYIFFETMWNGQTPGKRMVGLRVIRDGGYPIDFRAALTRNLLRLVDFLPAVYTVGIICVMLHPEARRVGDMAAGTLVIREREESIGEGDAGFTWQTASPEAGGPHLALDALDVKQFELVETFLRRRSQLTPELRYQMASQIAQQIRATLQLDPMLSWNDERLLEEVIKGRSRRAGL